MASLAVPLSVSLRSGSWMWALLSAREAVADRAES